MEKTPDCGVVGCKALRGDGKPLPSIRFFPTPWRIFLMKAGLSDKLPFFKEINSTRTDDTKIQECDWVTGCCLLVRKTNVDELGVLLRPELFMYNDDNDLCLRVKKKGWKVYYHPTEIVHLSGINNEKIAKVESDKLRYVKLTLESDYIYMRKNHSLFTVWSHFFLILCYEFLKCLKGLFKPNRSQIFHDSKQLIALAWSILKQTNYGERSLPRN
jgi:N-acetylglucosaminyl-diphospho-decaprenol L-rhamnosyltransferase